MQTAGDQRRRRHRSRPKTPTSTWTLFWMWAPSICSGCWPRTRRSSSRPITSTDQSVTSVSIKVDGEVVVDRLNAWLGELLSTKGVDIFRSKGILAIAGEENQYVFQGVHMLFEFDGTEGRPWPADETRTNRMVFIGLQPRPRGTRDRLSGLPGAGDVSSAPVTARDWRVEVDDGVVALSAAEDGRVAVAGAEGSLSLLSAEGELQCRQVVSTGCLAAAWSPATGGPPRPRNPRRRADPRSRGHDDRRATGRGGAPRLRGVPTGLALPPESKPGASSSWMPPGQRSYSGERASTVTAVAWVNRRVASAAYGGVHLHHASKTAPRSPNALHRFAAGAVGEPRPQVDCHRQPGCDAARVATGPKWRRTVNVGLSQEDHRLGVQPGLHDVGLGRWKRRDGVGLHRPRATRIHTAGAQRSRGGGGCPCLGVSRRLGRRGGLRRQRRGVAPGPARGPAGPSRRSTRCAGTPRRRRCAGTGWVGCWWAGPTPP